MRGLWSTSKTSRPGLADWENSGWEKNAREKGKVIGATPLFAPLPSTVVRNDILISDVAGWSGFACPNNAFGDRWQEEGGLPAVAKVVIEKTPAFSGFELVLGISNPAIPGVMALLRVNGQLTILCVVDVASSVEIEIHLAVERARKVTCQLAGEYCVDEAILLFHATARRANPLLANAFGPLGIPHTDEGLLYAYRASEALALFVGWITNS